MKYGQQLHEQCVPQWAPYNLDYDELKNLIKTNTSSSPGQGVAIPGHDGAVTEQFEDSFFLELTSQHDRVDLFVRSKAEEIDRRLGYLHKAVRRLLARSKPEGKPWSQKRRHRFAKYDSLISRCLEDIRSLQHFVDAQRIAFHKILKKYQKWTGSRILAQRFRDEILGNIKSFTKRDFQPLLAQSKDLLAHLRASTPSSTIPASPMKSTRRLSSHAQPPSTARATSYWNEYDDGSDCGEETYAIYVDPEDSKSSTFPGAQTLSYMISTAKTPVEKFRAWLTPPSSSSSSNERSALLRDSNTNGSYFSTQHSTADTDVEDTAAETAETSSVEYPFLFQHHASFTDHKLNLYQEKVLFYCMLCSFVASAVLLFIASILVATGKHKLRVEVDLGVVVGSIASLFFSTLGIGATMYHKQKLGWLHRTIVGVVFVTICLFNGILLFVVVGNARW